MHPVFKPLAVLIGLIACAQASYATERVSTYPSKAIRLITPFAPGGATDVIGRYLAQKLSQDVGQQIVLDPRPSSGGILACRLAASAEADGHTLLMGSNGTHAMNVSLYSKLPYDPVRDFEPITRVILIANVLTVHPSVSAKSIPELIRFAKNKPGTLKYASSGSGSPPHLAGELFKSMAQVDITHIPYKGGAQSTIALLSAEVDINFNTLVTSLPHIRSGKARALGVTTSTRSETLPDVPTIAESGVPGYEAATWYGLFAPARTPVSILDRLSASLGATLKSADTRERYTAMGGETVADSRAVFATVIKQDITKWQKIVAAAGARLD